MSYRPSKSRYASRVATVLVAAALVCAPGAAGLAESALSATPGTFVTGAEGELIFTGTTEPFAQVDVPSMLHGVLAEVNVKEGQAVKKGDALAKLDDALQIQQVELARLEAEQVSEIKGAENQIDFARNDLDAMKGRGSASEIREKELTFKQSQLALDVQKDRQKQAQVKLKQEQITLERMTLKSPIDGFVLRVHKQAGEQTDDGPVITVVQTSRLRAVFYLPKQLFGKLSPGQRVALDCEGTKREGVLAEVDPAIAAGLFRVKLEIDNDDARIPAGINATWIFSKK